MPQRRLLYLDANHLSACLWQSGTLRDEAHFQPTNEGLAEFSQYLARHRGSNYYLLADIAEEGFQIEALPYTQGSDRKAILARKLGQFFYGSPLAVAISLGREKTGRRDEKILFTALTRPQLFEPWLAALKAAEAQLAGVYSLPLLGAQLLAKIPPRHSQCLLVTMTRAGVRQSFFEEGQIRFSRLTPLSAEGAVETATACAAEAAKIHQYLLGQRMIARGTPLPVVALAHPAHMGAFLELCRKTEGLQPQIADLHAVGRACGLKTYPQDSRCEALFLHLLGQSPPRDQFAAPAERRFYRLWQARSALKSAGAIALFGCLLFAGKQFHEALDLRGVTAETQAQSASDGQKYTDIQKTFPPMPTSTDNLRAVISRYDELEKRSPPLEPLYLAISRGLHESPRIEIERIDWLLGGSPDEGAQAQGARPAAAASGDKAGGSAAYMISIVSGSLPTAMAGDQRGQLAAIDSFVEALRKDASLKVTTLRLPFDIESGKSLKSSADTPQNAVQPKFLVHISRKI